MFRKLVSMFALAAILVGSGFYSAKAKASDDNVRTLSLGENQAYTVVYWNVRFPDRWHVYGTYGDWATALRVANFINSFPEYRAVIQ